MTSVERRIAFAFIAGRFRIFFFLLKALWEHRLKQEQAKKLLGKPLESRDLVFSHPDGRPIRPDSVTRAFHKIAESVRLRGVRLHDLRHAHATILLQQGVNPKIVQERLGHSSVSTTLDIYSHVLPGLQEAAARQFDEGFEHEVHQENVGKIILRGLFGVEFISRRGGRVD